MIKINIQNSYKNKKKIPNKNLIKKWIKKIIKKSIKKSIITIKIVKKKEIKKLNYIYRKKNVETNILSFSIINGEDNNNSLLIGDLIICKSVLEKESKKYKIKIIEHWAHIIIHGILHLIGYKHNNLLDRKNMEKIEIQKMISLGYKNPYYIK
ncbi:MAG: rRNA maturation RNase YbeY [Buchnera aphidicola (Periphyllus acericola)]|uniref:rRNA maturation RNase YbeY n=1 Tax=Buchnera aphidicola TaxID=9 RepID=UPI0030CEADD4|nr:rRNA maturation RNase YbeY [Buchnera aphidicola (Periphyllus acericola)]